MKKECVAMILAGGQGSRLSLMTKKVAKPAVSFGGKYRIIDFPLSNCSNSDIDTVGVLTQYKPLVLNSYIGIGSTWDLDRKMGGVNVLPPYVTEEGGEWYKGTAHAVFQNIDFIDQYDPEYVLILSGDHIYKMDYSDMLDDHKATGADATISVMEVPMEEANRFGIMNTNSENKVVEFEEKPKNPKSNLASMGIYIFNWQTLRRYLIDDEFDVTSSHDFGKNIIPKMLAKGQKMFAYRFNGYWMDIGTVNSYWEANMDLLSENPGFDLYDKSWKVYSVNPNLPSNYISPNGKVSNSIISEGSQIYGKVENCIVSSGVIIGEGTHVKDSVIMPNVTIGSNCIIEKTIICEKTKIGNDCVIGASSEIDLMNSDSSNHEITIIGESYEMQDGTSVKPGDAVGNENENLKHSHLTLLSKVQ